MSPLPAFASVEDLEDRLGRALEDADLMRAQAALDDASALIRVEAGTGVTWDSIDDVGAAYQGAIVAVTLAVARRVMENPELAQSKSMGDASVTFGDSSNDVFLKASERRLIHRAAGRSALGYVDLEVGTPAWTGDFIDVVGQDEPMPFTYEPLRP